MKSKPTLLMTITTIVCLLPMILAALIYTQLPSQIPIHFDNSGVADGYLPKAIACYGLPIGFALLNLYSHFSLNSDPKRENSSKTMKLVGKWAIPVASIIAVPCSLFIALGKNIPIHIIIPALVGVLIIVIGNYLPKSRQNYTIGIKLPWALSNENNWNKTHRLAGMIWIVGGFVILISSFLQFYSLLINLIAISLLVIIPIIYSFSLYKKEV